MWLSDKKTIFLVALTILMGEFFYISEVNVGREIFSWYDAIMHFLGGVIIAMIYLNLTDEFKDWWSSAGSFQLLISATAFVMFVGVLWEFYEFISASFLHQMVLTLPDTLSDLFFDALGGFFLVLTRIFLVKNK